MPRTRGADKSLARPGRKQANISVRMVSISFGALPCRKNNLMSVRFSRVLKSRASLKCFRACFLPGQAKDYQHRGTTVQFTTSLLALDYRIFLICCGYCFTVFFSYIFRSAWGKLFYYIKIGKNYIFQLLILKITRACLTTINKYMCVNHALMNLKMYKLRLYSIILRRPLLTLSKHV